MEGGNEEDLLVTLDARHSSEIRGGAINRRQQGETAKDCIPNRVAAFFGEMQHPVQIARAFAHAKLAYWAIQLRP